jgi:hypothetical protein
MDADSFISGVYFAVLAYMTIGLIVTCTER